MPTSITMDFSFPYLHSTCFAFNNEFLLDYINRCYDCAFSDSFHPESKAQLQICIAHVMHAVSSNLTKKAVPPITKKLALHAVAVMALSDNCGAFKECLTKTITMFGVRHVPKKFLETITEEVQKRSQLEKSDTFAELELTLKPEIDFQTIVPDTDSQLQRDQSKLYQYFLKKQEQVKKVMEEEHTTDDENPFYSTDVINTIRDVYFPYYPLWGSFRGRHPKTTINKVSSNATVESYFKNHKLSFHPSLNEYGPKYAKEHGKIVVGIVHNNLQKLLLEDSNRNPVLKQKAEEVL